MVEGEENRQAKLSSGLHMCRGLALLPCAHTYSRGDEFKVSLFPLFFLHHKAEVSLAVCARVCFLPLEGGTWRALVIIGYLDSEWFTFLPR